MGCDMNFSPLEDLLGQDSRQGDSIFLIRVGCTKDMDENVGRATSIQLS